MELHGDGGGGIYFIGGGEKGFSFGEKLLYLTSGPAGPGRREEPDTNWILLRCPVSSSAFQSALVH